MSCPNPVQLSRALVEGIDDRLRAHLDICTACSEEVAAHSAIARDMRNLPVVEPSPDHARNIRAALLTAARVPAPAPSSTRFVWGFAAGVLAAAAVLAFVLMRPSEEQAPSLAHAELIPHEGAALMRVASAEADIARLAHGTVTVARGKRTRVITGDADVEGDGSFDVHVDRDHLRAVRVLEGRVVVRAAGAAPKTLVAGERWEVELAQAEPPAPAPIVPPPVVDEPAPVDVVMAPTKPERAHHPKASPLKQPPQIRAEPAVTAPKIVRAKRPIELLFDEGWAALAAGDAAKAAAVFDRAAKSAPDDPLAEDARFWHASALTRAKSSGAAAALDAFLARHGSSPRAGEASAMLGWLVIDRDLDRAERLFKAAENDRAAAVRASAKKGLGVVETRRAR